MSAIINRSAAFQPGTITVWLLNIYDAKKVPETFCRVHFPQRVERSLRFRFEADRLRCLSAGLLIQGVLGLEENEICLSETGKPYSAHSPCFSLTHSGDYAALAVGDKPLGVDLESPTRANISVMRQVFAAEEIQYVDSDPERFAILWTLKESLGKAVGQGLAMPLKSLNLLPMLAGQPVLWQGREYYGRSGALAEGHSVLSTVSEASFEMTVKRWLPDVPAAEDNPLAGNQ